MRKRVVPTIKREEQVIDLRGLNEEEEKFWLKAKKYFRKNTDWISFENFVFGSNSPIFKGKRRRIEVKKDKLFQAVNVLLLSLGQRQGAVGPSEAEKRIRIIDGTKKEIRVAFMASRKK